MRAGGGVCALLHGGASDCISVTRSGVNHISGLRVIDAEANLVGILTEGDFLRRSETGTERKRPRWLEFLTIPGRLADKYIHARGRRIEEVMTPEPVAVTEDTPIGIFLGTVAPSMPQLGLLYVLLFMPMNMLSGSNTPLEWVPSWLSTVMQASPWSHPAQAVTRKFVRHGSRSSRPSCQAVPCPGLLTDRRLAIPPVQMRGDGPYCETGAGPRHAAGHLQEGEHHGSLCPRTIPCRL